MNLWGSQKFFGVAGFHFEIALTVVVALGLANVSEMNGIVVGQDGSWNAVSETTGNQGAMWQETDSNSSGAPSDSLANDGTDPQTFVGPTTTRYSLELSKLPDSDGQFWVVYDITPYTDRFPNVSSPQDSIVDWILFDSGEGFWRKEPFSILNVSRERLYVYHSSSVQRYVSNVVDRFIDPEKKNTNFSIKIIALLSPDWRSRTSHYLSPLNTTIIGNGADVQGWQADRSDIARIEAELAKRPECLLLNDGKHVVPNGETYGWAAAQPRKEFNRDYRIDSNSSSGYSADVSSVDEGFRIEATPLLSTTGETLELTFRYRSTVVEKARTFSMRVPTSTSPRQQLNVEKPSIVSCDFRGKISVPRSKGAIIDLGLVPLAPPTKKKNNEPNGALESISGFLSQKSVFYDVLLVIEENGF